MRSILQQKVDSTIDLNCPQSQLRCWTHAISEITLGSQNAWLLLKSCFSLGLAINVTNSQTYISTFAHIWKTQVSYWSAVNAKIHNFLQQFFLARGTSLQLGLVWSKSRSLIWFFWIRLCLGTCKCYLRRKKSAPVIQYLSIRWKYLKSKVIIRDRFILFGWQTSKPYIT